MVLLTKLTFVAADPPMLTVAPRNKRAAVDCYRVPPAVVPEFGVILLTLGPELLHTRNRW